MEKKAKRGIWIYIIIVIALIAVCIIFNNMNQNVNAMYTNADLVKDLKRNAVKSVEVIQNKEVPTGKILVSFADGSYIKFYTSDVKDTEKILKDDSSIRWTLTDVQRQPVWEKALPYIFAVLLFAALIFILFGRASAMGGGQAGQLSNFGKSRARKMNSTFGFKDVAGLEEEKEELAQIVDFLKDPAKYLKVGAHIPKGVILVGPPGTGKTLLAKAVSGEAGVPFFSISGSDFVEMFVGVGAARVRDLFEEAKKCEPCIIFIDEIDAVARRRGSGLGGGHDEREQTLNQLLVEMDGMAVNTGIIVMAATNRIDILDPAILRPGRFDRKVAVGRPDIRGREEILKIHTKKKPLADNVDLHEIARTTAGFSGADIENLMNESAILAARNNRLYISKEDIDSAFIKVGIGTEKRSRVVPESERKITAYHESGHAILFHELSKMDKVYRISIIPTGIGAAGYTMPLPENDNVFMTKTKMMQQIEVSLGGRIAEEIIFDDITTGASQDIKEASRYARAMVVKYGFSDKLGLINYEPSDDDEVFIGREIGHTRSYSEKIASDIDEEVKKIMDECYKKAREIIEANIDILHESSKLLLEQETLNGEEFDALFKKGQEV